MGCSQSNVFDRKKLNVPKSVVQEAKAKNLVENMAKNVEASQAKELKKIVEPLNNIDKAIKEDKALLIDKTKELVKEEAEKLIENKINIEINQVNIDTKETNKNKEEKKVENNANNASSTKKEDLKEDKKITPPLMNKEEIKKVDANIKKESDNKNKAQEEIKNFQENIIKPQPINKNENKKNTEINKNTEKKKTEVNKNNVSPTKKDLKKETEKNKKPVPKKNEETKPANKTNKNTNTNTKKNEIDIVMDLTKEGKNGRNFIGDYFEEEANDKNKQYTKNNVEIYIDNNKTKFTRSIDEEEFPKEKVYHIKLKFKNLLTNCEGMFADCKSITSIDLSNFDMSKIKTMQAMFNTCSNLVSVKFPNSNTVNLTNMNFMFAFCENLANVNITALNTKNVEGMNVLFRECKKLKNLDISQLDIGKVKDKGMIFYGCVHETSFKLPKGIIKEDVKIIFRGGAYDPFFHEEFVKNNKNKIKLIYKNKEYELCTSIRDIDSNFQDEIIDVKLKVIGTLTNLSYMFSDTDLYYIGDLSKLDTSKVTDMSYLFYQNKTYEFDDNSVITWDTSNVKNMSYLFSESSITKFPDISKWNTSNVTNMKAMFSMNINHPTLPDISKWDVSNVTDMS